VAAEARQMPADTAPDQSRPNLARYRALVVCTHLRPSRDKRRTRYFMQPITGLHIGSLIDPSRFDVELYHEDWHGPFDSSRCGGYDLVFLTGLQPDFDRMRQLSYFFRRNGAAVVAGGSICTSFPEFATQFFDAVCVGGVDSVPAVVADFLNGSMKPVYRSPAARISPYALDYSLFTRNGIDPNVHLMETSRGCSFKCSFCVIPAEVGAHATYDLSILRRAIDNAIETSPRFSFRRRYPLLLFHDNNFSDDRSHMLAVSRMLREHPKVRGWAALVTQNILHDRKLVAELAASKCFGLFAGLESFDLDLLKRYRKTQNLSRRFDIIEDVKYAESLGLPIGYGYLFDPRHQTADDMEKQMVAIADDPRMPMPVYLSVVAPLAGTQCFWDDLADRKLASNLRLRDLDGETLCYATLADDPARLAGFVERLFRRPWTVVSRRKIFIKSLRRIVRSGTFNPVRWMVIAGANLHCFVWSRGTPSAPRSYIAGVDTLDPQYGEYPPGLPEDDRNRYFEPIALTDENGRPMAWLKRYIPGSAEQRPLPRQEATIMEEALAK
jgi:hypothetical protein